MSCCVVHATASRDAPVESITISPARTERVQSRLSFLSSSAPRAKGLPTISDISLTLVAKQAIGDRNPKQ